MTIVIYLRKKGLMRLICFFLFNYILLSTIHISGQDNEWTMEDSLWLQRVLSGKEKLHLNDATRKAIQSGTLISDPSESRKMIQSPSELPINKSFEGITSPEQRKKNITELPPSVFKIYSFEQDNIQSEPNNQATSFTTKQIAELKTIESTTPRKAVVNDKEQIRPGKGGVFSAEDLARDIFWPSHRAKKRNAKRANAWKNYNEYQ